MVEALHEQHPHEMATFMLRRGIAVRDLTTLPGCGRGLYRIAIRLREENVRLVRELRAYDSLSNE